MYEHDSPRKAYSTDEWVVIAGDRSVVKAGVVTTGFMSSTGFPGCMNMTCFGVIFGVVTWTNGGEERSNPLSNWWEGLDWWEGLESAERSTEPLKGLERGKTRQEKARHGKARKGKKRYYGTERQGKEMPTNTRQNKKVRKDMWGGGLIEVLMRWFRTVDGGGGDVTMDT